MASFISEMTDIYRAIVQLHAKANKKTQERGQDTSNDGFVEDGDDCISMETEETSERNHGNSVEDDTQERKGTNDSSECIT